jgi:PKD domain
VAHSASGTAGWTLLSNESTGPTPAGELAGSLAYDAADREYVYFGGCASVCPTNITWTFANDIWQNVTDQGVAPPARYYASLSYDPNAGGVLLFGGVNVGGTDLGDTWLFRGGGWTEVNRTGPSARDSAAMAFDADPSINATLLFGGCTTSEPPTCYNDTWEWRPTVGWSRLDAASGPSPRGFAYGAYDPALGSIVVFGGLGPCPATDCDFHDTWQFVAGNWSEIPITGGAPGARYSGGFAFDPAGADLLLYGGYNLTMDSTYGDSWLFTGSQWDPLAVSPSPGERGDPALASGGYGRPPLLYGGGEDDAPTLPVDTWCFAAPLSVQTSGLGPDVDLGTVDGFNVTVAGGTAPYTVNASWGSGNGSATGEGPSFQFLASFTLGPHLVSVGVQDVFAFSATANLSFTVVPAPKVGIVMAQNVSDVGLELGFLGVTDSQGVAPLGLNWSFGDGSFASGAITSHNYSSAGSYVVTLTGTDAVGTVARASASVQILAGPNVTAAVGGTPAVNATLNFSSHVNGGLPPYSIVWRFGDGQGSTEEDPVYAYGSSGNFTVQVWANDSLGASAHATLLVRVPAPNSTPVRGPPVGPSASSGTEPWVWEAVAAAAAVAVVGAVVFLRRRRGPSRPD